MDLGTALKLLVLSNKSWRIMKSILKQIQFNSDTCKMLHIRYHWLELFSFFNNSQINFILHWLKRLGNVLWMCFYETFVNIVSICIPTTEIQFFLIICISSSLFHCYKEMFLKQKCASCVWQRSLNKYSKTKKLIQ